MPEENRQLDKPTADSNELLPAILKFSKSNPWASFVAGLALIIFTLNISGLSIGTLTEKYFGLEEKKLDQTYQLQMEMNRMIKEDMLAKIDAVMKRLENHEGRITNLESRVQSIETENKKYHK